LFAREVTYVRCTFTGKRAYKSRRAAMLANRHNGANLRAYQCEYGRHWHVTRHYRINN
jgi:hypothetical protein